MLNGSSVGNGQDMEAAGRAKGGRAAAHGGVHHASENAMRTNTPTRNARRPGINDAKLGHFESATNCS